MVLTLSCVCAYVIHDLLVFRSASSLAPTKFRLLVPSHWPGLYLTPEVPRLTWSDSFQPYRQLTMPTCPKSGSSCVEATARPLTCCYQLQPLGQNSIIHCGVARNETWCHLWFACSAHFHLWTSRLAGRCLLSWRHEDRCCFLFEHMSPLTCPFTPLRSFTMPLCVFRC